MAERSPYFSRRPEQIGAMRAEEAQAAQPPEFVGPNPFLQRDSVAASRAQMGATIPETGKAPPISMDRLPRRPAVLPFAKYESGYTRPAVPGLIQDVIDAAALPGNVYRGEVAPTPEAALDFAMELGPAGIASSRALGTVGDLGMSAAPKPAKLKGVLDYFDAVERGEVIRQPETLRNPARLKSPTPAVPSDDVYYHGSQNEIGNFTSASGRAESAGQTVGSGRGIKEFKGDPLENIELQRRIARRYDANDGNYGYLSSDEMRELIARSRQADLSQDKVPVFGASDPSTPREYAEQWTGSGVNPGNVYQVQIPRGERHLQISAGGDKWDTLSLDSLRDTLLRKGHATDEVDAVLGRRPYMLERNVNRNDRHEWGRISTDAVADIANSLGYETIDITNVLDSGVRGAPPTSLRMTLTPENIKILKKLGIAGVIGAGGATVLSAEQAAASEDNEEPQ